MAILCMRIACWIPEAPNTNSVYVILFLLHCNNGCTNAPQCYVYTYIACLAETNFMIFIMIIITSVPLRNYYEIFLKHLSLSNALFILANCTECLKVIN